MLWRAVPVTVTRTVNAVKLNEQKIGAACFDIITNFRSKLKILCGVVRNADVVFNDAVGYGIPIAIRPEYGMGVYLSYSSE